MRFVELSWEVYGTVDADYGYPLYSAICHRLDRRLHEEGAPWSMSPVLVHEGAAGGGLLRVESGEIMVRCAAELVPDFADIYAPGGLAIRESGLLQMVHLSPQVRPIRPCARLFAARVTIKAASAGTSRLERLVFEERLRAQLAGRGLRIHHLRSGPAFTIRVGQQLSHGYAVELDGLSPEASLALQVRGAGGRLRMGCGFFLGEGQC